jgi:alpha-glucosidase
MSEGTVLWWQSGTVYQIYPRSFRDSNADGIGDLAGITSRLDYLTWLGVDSLWLSPFYPSPMADFGYDISNYVDVDPIFGNLADFDKLLEAAHARNLKILVDFVPNHTSDEHEWFKESRSSRDNPKSDWYIWHDPKPNGDPPNNWLSNFGGSAWQFDKVRQQYYLHLFDVKQPDLNWRNPDVVKAMLDVMRFWFDRGVDGLRIDVIYLLFKDEALHDNPLDPNWKEGEPNFHQQIKKYTEDQPEMDAIILAMRKVADEYHERVLIGEIWLPYDRLVRYYGAEQNGLQLPFNFQLLLLTDWQASSVRQLVESYESVLPKGAWPNWVLGNHDKSRVATRLGTARSRLAQMLLLTLRGTPTLYYGDELGMEDVKIPPGLARDPQEKGSPGFGRDPERTPMQWDASPNAGFSSPGATTWLPLAPDYRSVNVAAEKDDPASMLSFVHKLLELRRDNPALNMGAYRSVESSAADCFVYEREGGGKRFVVALNFSDHPQTLAVNEAGPAQGQAKILISTHIGREGHPDLGRLELQAFEGVVIEL